MNDALTKASMDGLVVTARGLAHPLPLDFAVSMNGLTFLFATYWWRADRPSPNDDFFGLPGPLVPTAHGDWEIEGSGREVVVSAPDDGDLWQLCRDHRDTTDFERDAYLRAVDRLVAQEFPVAFTVWRDAFRLRPNRDSVAEFASTHYGQRKVGGLFLKTSDNTKIDALVLDENGLAANVAPDSWLAPFAQEWADKKDRPSIETYVEWLAGQQPYGPYQLQPFYRTESGTPGAIASRLLSQ